MSKRVYKTANGKVVNLDAVIAQNEEAIAIGNMRVNARGDELGPGGKIERSREKIMAEYYKLNTPVASDYIPIPKENKQEKDLEDDWKEPLITTNTQDIHHNEVTTEVAPLPRNIRGSLASSIAKVKPTEEVETKKSGPSRI